MGERLDRGLKVAGLALAAAGVALVMAGCSKMPGTVKIGVAQPLSGHEEALGQDLLNGVTMAVKELNHAGFIVDGKRVNLEVVAFDDKADTATGRTVAKQLVDAGVVGVIGHLNSRVSIAAAPIYGAKGIPQLAVSTHPQFTQSGQTAFRLVANDALQARAMGAFAAAQLSASGYAVLDNGTLYGVGLADGAAQVLAKENKSVKLRRSFDSLTTDFDGVAADIKAANLTVILAAMSDFQAMALIQALKKVGHTQVTILGGDGIKTTAMAQYSGTVEAIYATSPVLEAREFITGRQFVEKYFDEFKTLPAYGGHYAYDATYVLTAAIKRAGSADPKVITKTLHTLSGYAPVTGSMSWDAKGEQRYGAVGVYGLRGGVWEARMRSDRW